MDRSGPVSDQNNSPDELAVLLSKAKGKPDRLGAQGVLALGRSYRQAVAKLARQRRDLSANTGTTALESRVMAAHALIYGSDSRDGSTTVRYAITTGYWQAVRGSPPALALAAGLLIASGLLGFLWASLDPSAAGGFVPGAFQGATQVRPHGAHLGLPLGVRATFAAAIFTHNIVIAIMAFVGGIFAALPSAAALLFNGAVLGVVGALAANGGQGDVFLQLVLPHGVLELSCIVVAGSAGLRLGWTVIEPGKMARSVALYQEASRLVIVALGTSAWLVVAGLTEGLVTPMGLGLTGALAVGFGLATLFWGLVLWRGSPSKAGPRLEA